MQIDADRAFPGNAEVVVDKDPGAFRTISEAAEELDLPQHVLRFWETRFPQITPMKRAGGRRYYRQDDVGLLAAIRHLLYGEGYTIKGVQRILKQQHGAKAVIELVQQLRTQRAPAGAAALANAAANTLAGEVGRDGGGHIEPVAGARFDGAEAGQGPRPPAPAGLTGEQQRHLQAALAGVEECLELLALAKAA